MVGKSHLFPSRHLGEDSADAFPAGSITMAKVSAMLAHTACRDRPRLGHQKLALHAAVTEHGLLSYQIPDRLADCLPILKGKLARFQKPGSIDEDF